MGLRAAARRWRPLLSWRAAVSACRRPGAGARVFSSSGAEGSPAEGVPGFLSADEVPLYRAWRERKRAEVAEQWERYGRGDPRSDIRGCTVVADVESARWVSRHLLSAECRERWHACDTETHGWSPEVSPWGNGRVIATSHYVGPGVDFGSGSRIFVDATVPGVLEEFRAYWEEEGVTKVFHNYTFDRAMMSNMGIKVKGFACDTMAMARLWDSSRSIQEGGAGYSLAALAQDLLGTDPGTTMDMTILGRAMTKTDMRERFKMRWTSPFDGGKVTEEMLYRRAREERRKLEEQGAPIPADLDEDKDQKDEDEGEDDAEEEEDNEEEDGEGNGDDGGKGVGEEALDPEDVWTEEDERQFAEDNRELMEVKLVDASAPIDRETSDELKRKFKLRWKHAYGRKYREEDDAEGWDEDERVGEAEVMPDTLFIQNHPEARLSWIQYATDDAVLTWALRERLEEKLDEQDWVIEGSHGGWNTFSHPETPDRVKTMWDFYVAFWSPFSVVLADLEDRGLYVDVDLLNRAEHTSMSDAFRCEAFFINWLKQHTPNKHAEFINLDSAEQLTALLFGGGPPPGSPLDGDEEVEPPLVVHAGNVWGLWQYFAATDGGAGGGARRDGHEDDATAGGVDGERADGASPGGLTEEEEKNLMAVEWLEDKGWLQLRDGQCVVSLPPGPASDATLGAEGPRGPQQTPEAWGVDEMPPRYVYEYLGLEPPPPEAYPDGEGLGARSEDRAGVDPEGAAEDDLARERAKRDRLRDEMLDLLGMKQSKKAPMGQRARGAPPADKFARADRGRASGGIKIEDAAEEEDEDGKPLEFGASLSERRDKVFDPNDYSDMDDDEGEGGRDRDHVADTGPQMAEWVRIPEVRWFNVEKTASELEAERRAKDQKFEAEYQAKMAAYTAKLEKLREWDISRGREPRKGAKPPTKKVVRTNAMRRFPIVGLQLQPPRVEGQGKLTLDSAILDLLAGTEDDPGPAYGQLGPLGCQALRMLSHAKKIDTLSTTFLWPMRDYVSSGRRDSRIRASLQVSTETGRLSSQRPNLQNQPSVDKDFYGVRACFSAPPGKALVVADYGQLELRLLAHMSGCKSMIEAFAMGGDFHSRTAMGMYEYIAADMKSGAVTLERRHHDDMTPTIQEKYSDERKKAKMLNFSIAYGKTSSGLAQSWGVSKEEADETVARWFRDRPEVAVWQERKKEYGHYAGITRTLLGRQRILPRSKWMDPTRKEVEIRERVSINSPIQGGAADVVTLAMCKLNNSDALRKMGYMLILQIHDEIVMEGPEEHLDAAIAEISNCMQNPFPAGWAPLKVALDVDARHAHNWMDGK